MLSSLPRPAAHESGLRRRPRRTTFPCGSRMSCCAGRAEALEDLGARASSWHRCRLRTGPLRTLSAVDSLDTPGAERVRLAGTPEPRSGQRDARDLQTEAARGLNSSPTFAPRLVRLTRCSAGQLAFSSRSAIQTLMMARRVSPRRPASRRPWARQVDPLVSRRATAIDAASGQARHAGTPRR